MTSVRSDNRRKSTSSSRQRKARTNSDGRKPLQGRDTGYRVGSSRRQTSSRSINPRLIIAGVVGILVLIALVFGISSCVKGCSKKNSDPKGEEVQQVNPDDERVAYGVSSEDTAKLSAILDRNEAFAKIAKSADKITDSRLIDLAIAEPDAIEFVANSIKNDGSTQAYGENVTQGEYPQLYTFDPRWGYMQYADGILGVTGSGPVALSMASMGLSGKNNYDPATIAEAITSAKLANGTTGMDDSFLSNHASDAGLSATSVEASSDGVYTPIADSEPVIIKLKADSGIGSPLAHWALITQLNSDNSINVYDPTSVAASSHSWSLGAITSKTDTAYALSSSSGSSSSSGDEYDESYDESSSDEYGSGYSG